MNNEVILDLRYNKISNIIRDTTTENKAKAKNIHLYLSNNDLDCDCLHATILHEWNNSGYLWDFPDIICSDKQNVSKIDPYILCNRTNAIIAMAGFGIVVALIAIIVLLTIIANRQQIWNIILDILQRYKNHESVTMEMDQNDEEAHDVFISFAHEDKDLVIEGLKPTLQKEFGLKVFTDNNEEECINDIEEALSSDIKDVIERARFFVIILTKDYINSNRLYLEFKIAHDLNKEEGSPKVILILFDESITRNEKLNSELKMYISFNTYLLWKDPRFWEKLTIILPKKQKTK